MIGRRVQTKKKKKEFKRPRRVRKPAHAIVLNAT